MRCNGSLDFISKPPHSVSMRPLFEVVAATANRIEQRGVTEHCCSKSEGADSSVHVVPEVVAMVVLTWCSKHPDYLKPGWMTAVHLHDLRRSSVDEPRAGFAQRPGDRNPGAWVDVCPLDARDVGMNSSTGHHGATLRCSQRILVVELSS